MEQNKAVILIVDDLPSNIQALSAAIGGDYTVFFALNGEEALSQTRNLKPDLILLDVVMPGMTGLDVCMKLKEDPELSDIPVIFITAYGQEDEEIAGLKLGAVDYISKPFNPALVRLRVGNYIELKRRHDVLQQRTKELEEALKNVKMLKGLLPICASCKKIRNDNGYWDQLEKYFCDHSEIMFTHGLCPDCINKLYPGLDMNAPEPQIPGDQD